MENFISHGFKELTDEHMSRFKQQVYEPYHTRLSQHLHFRFPDVALLDAFGIIDLNVMEEHTIPDLLEKLELFTDHYGPHHVIDSDSTIYEALTMHDLMSKLTSNSAIGHVPQFRQALYNRFGISHVNRGL